MLGTWTVLSTWKRDKGAGRTATVVVVAAAIGLNVIYAALVHAAFPGLLFASAPAAAAGATPAQTVSVAQVAARTGKTPAEVVIDQVLANTPTLPSGARPATAFQGVPSTPMDVVCGPRKGPGPVTAKGRGWTVATGSQVGNFRAGYTVTMSAYGAGQGAVAFTALQAQVNAHCANRNGTAYIVTSAGVGTDAATAWVNRSGSTTTVFLWRRGDLIAMVAATGPGVPMNMVKEYDARMAAALAGVCAATDSVVADGSRNPYAGKALFTGLTTPRPVGLPAGVSAPAPAPVVDAPVVVPVVTLPTPPAAPYWPDTLPAPVVSPTAPAPLTYPATTTSIPVRVPDSQGPGCGWVFTGQPVPHFDQTTADQDANTRAVTAAGELAATAAAYTDALPAYQVQYAQYVKDLAAFGVYAKAVDTVAAAWDTIRSGQTQYADALALYTTAVTARDAFLTAQAAATTVYNTALAGCAAGSAVVTPVPVIQPAPLFPNPITSPDPVPSPTPTPTPSPTSTVVVCPPVPAPIMTQPVPAVPVAPTPPPDPRPTPRPTP